MRWRDAWAAVALACVAPATARPDDAPRVRKWVSSGPSATSVDVVFLGDGYQRKHLAPTGKYWTDVKRYATRFLAEPPFSWYRDRFNVRAVFLESEDEGCDARASQNKVATVLDCAFDAPDGRLLAFRDAKALEAAVRAAGEVDIAFVMVNTERYGGAGTVLHQITQRGRPLPAPTFSAQDTASFLIALHELGHSFADLADEYVDPLSAPRYPLPEGPGDLREPNVTLAAHIDTADFATVARTAKWGHFLRLPGAKKHRWNHEGGHLRASGVFRPWERCRMRENGDPFCPVCAEEIAKAIVDACGEEWDDEAFHKDHPLSLWN